MPPGRPDRTAATIAKAVEAMNAGRLHRARDLAEQVIAANPQHAGALRLSGEVARRQGQYRKALDRFIDAARVDPSDVATLDAVNAMAIAVDRPDLAVEALEVSVIAAPTDARRHTRLAAAYREWHKLDEALGHLRIAATLDPDDTYTWQATADVHVARDDAPAALEAARRALELDPDCWGAMLAAAIAHEKLRDAEAAHALRERALTLAPDEPKVAYNTVDVRTAADEAGRLARIAAAVADPSRPIESRVEGMLALAALHAGRDEMEQAARFLIDGNELWATTLERRGRAYVPEDVDRQLDGIDRWLTEERLARMRQPSDLPVPIVIGGLPRAGKTLLEHRLVRRGGLLALGELPVLDAAARGFKAHQSSDGQGFPIIGRGQIAAVRAKVVDGPLRGLPVDGAAAMVIAAPNAELMFHLVLLLHPDAVLVVCDRDPRDLALANLLKFMPYNNPAASRLGWVEHRIAAADRAVRDWQHRLPGQVRRVSYESLVTNPAAVVDELLVSLPVGAAAEPGPEETAPGRTSEVRSPAADPPVDLPLHTEHVGMWRRWVPYVSGIAELAVAVMGDSGHAT